MLLLFIKVFILLSIFHCTLSDDLYYKPKSNHNFTTKHHHKHRTAGTNGGGLGLSAFSKIYVINMHQRTDRMNFMINRLHELNISFERFEAFDFGNGKSEKIAEARQRFDPDTKFNESMVRDFLTRHSTNFETWGAAASWQSHLQVHFDIYRSDLPGPFLILEDDIRISSKLLDFLSYDSLNHKLPQDWEMLLLDHLKLTCYEGTSHDNLCLVSFAWSIAAYVVRNTVAVQKLISIGNSPYFQVADHYTNYLYQEKILHTYATIKKYVAQVQTNFLSDIRSKEKGQFDGYDPNILE